MASGAVPCIVWIFFNPNFSAFSSISRMPSGFLSMEYTSPSEAANAASMEMDPVPAPMSATLSVGRIPAFTITMARISAFVIGTFPRINSSSQIPNVCILAYHHHY